MATGNEGLMAWKAAHDTAAAHSLRGGALLARAGAAFVLPLAGALAGVIIAGGGETRRFVGLLAGLTFATITSIGLGRLMRRRGVEPICSESPAEPTAARGEESA